MLKNAHRKRFLFLGIVLILLFLMPSVVFAHSGRTDANGGHYNHATGEYHYHSGPLAQTSETVSDDVQDQNEESSSEPELSMESTASVGNENDSLRSLQRAINLYNERKGIPVQKASLEEIQEMVSDWISEADSMLSGFAKARKNFSSEEFQKYNNINPLKESALELKELAFSSEDDLGEDVVNSILFMLDLRMEAMDAYALDALHYDDQKDTVTRLENKVETLEDENSLSAKSLEEERNLSEKRLMMIYVLSCVSALLFLAFIITLIVKRRKTNSTFLEEEIERLHQRR